VRGGDDDSGTIVAAGVREGDDCDDLGELISGLFVLGVGEYIYAGECLLTNSVGVGG
jgi:hypothetical protein